VHHISSLPGNQSDRIDRLADGSIEIQPDSSEHPLNATGMSHPAMSAVRSAVPAGGQLDQTAARIDFLVEQNVALKERCKEIRLNLQRKITALQGTLTLTRQTHMREASELKVEYGRDLNRITKLSKERQAQLQSEFGILEQQKVEEMLQEFKVKEEQLHDDIVENAKRADEAVQLADSRVRDAERDLKKLKKESTGYFKGGWGTFIIAFEGKDLGKGSRGELARHGTTLSADSGKGKSLKKAKVSERAGPLESPRDGPGSASHRAEEDLLVEGAPHPIAKITHFVEVGFLVDRNDFRLINTFDEATYDSNLKKYLFEFQDSLQSSQMSALEFKVKQQLTENVGLFNEINPVYISLNMGRPSTAFADDYVPQD